MDRFECLDEAKKAVTTRSNAYGTPGDNFARAAALWQVVLGPKLCGDLSAVDIALCLAALKMARLIETPEHGDSWADLAGYAACGAEVIGAE